MFIDLVGSRQSNGVVPRWFVFMVFIICLLFLFNFYGTI